MPNNLSNSGRFINIKFSETFRVALADATIEFDFCYNHYLVKGKP